MSRDLHAEITAQIVNQLEKGSLAPWLVPWSVNAKNVSYQLPVNVDSGKRYKGINVPLLWMGEFPTNEFGTFKQWTERKETIRKGSKGTTVVYYDFIEKKRKKDEDLIDNPVSENLHCFQPLSAAII